MKEKGGIALLLGGPPGDDEESEDAGEMDAAKAFFKAGRAGDWAGATEALKEFLRACGVYDDEPDEAEDDESDDDMM